MRGDDALADLDNLAVENIARGNFHFLALSVAPWANLPEN
jgi:hypothetical protein